MKLTIYQVDAFTDKLFGGNPAAVIPLRSWIDERLMQQIAMENNLAETVYFVPKENDYEIRWFTPAAEINLCGHATLATAFILFNYLDYKADTVTFHSKSGPLVVSKQDNKIAMDFPSWLPEESEIWPTGLEEALGVKGIVAVFKHRDLLVELTSEEAVKNAKPDFTLIKQSGHKIIITAAGNEVDFVSRFFAPTLGIDEDPVTGSSHSQLIPYWSQKLGKTHMEARQLSARGGQLTVEQQGDRVIMAGTAVFYMKGEISI